MTTQPLTHHDILGLIEPFTRSGRQLDLAASDRIQRRLVFKSRAFDNPTAAANLMTDTLTLESQPNGACVLTRIVTHASGLAATLVASGADAGGLLQAVEAVEPASLFCCGDGWTLAYSYRLGLTAAAPPTLLLSQGEVRVQDLTLLLKMPAVIGYPAELTLRATAAIDLPDDLLQVLGRDWARLSRGAKNWRGTLTLRGQPPERSRLAEKQLATAARHLALTLSQPPAHFHQKQTVARWQVAARRAVPLMTLLALVLAALAVPYLGLEQNSVYWMLIFNAPPLLLLWGFSLREMPSFDLPRPPRRLTAASWWPEPPAAPKAGTVGAAPATHP